VKQSNPLTVGLTGRCYERESVPYKAFDGIADTLSLHLSQRPEVEVAGLMPPRAALLGDLFPVMQRVEAVASAPLESLENLDVQEQRKRMFRVLRELMATMAERQPLVLVIDDFQWADPDSLVLLDEIAHPETAPRLLLVATARTGKDGRHCAAVETASESARDVRHIQLGNLPQESAEKLVCMLAPELATRDPDAVKTIVEDASGHPLFIQELARWME
jgi:predicted ATPase